MYKHGISEELINMWKKRTDLQNVWKTVSGHLSKNDVISKRAVHKGRPHKIAKNWLPLPLVRTGSTLLDRADTP